MRGRRILTLDIGAYQLTMAEFRIGRGAAELVRYAMQPIASGLAADPDAMATIGAGIRDMMRAYRISPAPLSLSISGQIVFPRFVKLPPVAADKLAQIVRYEAEQNVPFPIDEVVWDYQVIGQDAGDRHAMLVAVKADIVEDLTRAVESAGLEPRVVDVSPLALHNVCVRNYEGAQGCSVILDIGARTTNLVFVEPPRVFMRSIPVAGNTITQELMKEFSISYEEAERLKREHGAVSAGGVTSAGDPVTDQVGKIVRGVMTRLHADVNRSINFYRSQQGGSRPDRVLLCGGSSTIAGVDTFFREKLGVDVAALNPFRVVAVAGSITSEEIARDAHLLGEVAGLALRAAGGCPSTINLMPRALVARKRFRRRVPYFVAAATFALGALGCWWTLFTQRAGAEREWASRVVAHQESFVGVQRELAQIAHEQREVRAVADRLAELPGERTRVSRALAEVRARLLDGMWLRAVTPVLEPSTGRLAGLTIRGYGFRDRLKQYDRETASAIEVFRDRLVESPLFDAAGTRIVFEGFIEAEWAKEFVIEIRLRAVGVGGA